MAKVNIAYNTKTKCCQADMDGEAMANLHAISVYKKWKDKPSDPDQYNLEMHQAEKHDEHDMVTHHHTRAAEKVPAGTAVKDSPLGPDFKVVVTTEQGGEAADSKAVKDIVSFFSNEDE